MIPTDAENEKENYGMKNVLIVCTSNKTRSPLAMEVANSIAEKKNAPYTFKSAGLAVIGSNVDDNVIAVLKEIGITTEHKPTHLSVFDIGGFDAIHVMTQRQKITLCSYCKAKNIESKITVLGVADPYYLGIEAYRRCRDQFAEFYETYINQQGV